jgi:hypothetical protein
MSEKSILDARLAEIDRRLRTIQADLEPAAQAVVPPEAAPVPKRLSTEDRQPSDLVARLTALVEAHERLLSLTRELTDRREPAGSGPSVSVSAGPFAGTEALRAFERSLQALPEVHSAVVREYEGADRAIVDVRLTGPTP